MLPSTSLTMLDETMKIQIIRNLLILPGNQNILCKGTTPPNTQPSGEIFTVTPQILGKEVHDYSEFD